MSGLRPAKRVGFLGVGIVVLALFVTAGGAAAQGMGVPGAGTQMQKRSIQVQGQATMSVEPMSRIALGVETQAIRRPRRRAPRGTGLKVLAALPRRHRQGKDEDELVSRAPYTHAPGNELIIGYKPNDNQVGDCGSVVGCGSGGRSDGLPGQMSPFDLYERKDMQAFKAQLIQAACTDAKMKADAAAAALGARVGAPVSVDIQDSFSARQTANVMMMKAAASPDFLSPGELDVSVSVSIEFDLRVE